MMKKLLLTLGIFVLNQVATAFTVELRGRTLSTTQCRYFSSAMSDLTVQIRGNVQDLSASFLFADVFPNTPVEIPSLEVRRTEDFLEAKYSGITSERGLYSYQKVYLRLRRGLQQTLVEEHLYLMPALKCDESEPLAPLVEVLY